MATSRTPKKKTRRAASAPTGRGRRPETPVVGLALGSGSARGWSHIGVILELEALGVKPQVVAGTSVGALVGAIYVTGQLKAFAEWVQKLSLRDVVGLVDLKFSGGVMHGEKLFGYFLEHHRNPRIESLKKRYVSVATEMSTGREIWITRGSVLQAARASCALPGLFSPVQFEERWMLDGGLVNPVPVSACRALGAEVIIAVNLNTQLIGAHLSSAGREQAASVESTQSAIERSFWARVAGYLSSSDGSSPGFFDVVAASINIMQDRITRSRMAGDPAEIVLVPLLEDFALMDFHRAEEAIAEGRRIVRSHEAEIRAWTGMAAPGRRRVNRP